MVKSLLTLGIGDADDMETGRTFHQGDVAFVQLGDCRFKLFRQGGRFIHHAQCAAGLRRGGILRIFLRQGGKIVRCSFCFCQHFFRFRFDFGFVAALSQGKHNVRHFLLGLCGRLLFGEGFFHFFFADGLPVSQSFCRQFDIFEFHRFRDEVFAFVFIVIGLQRGIVHFDSGGKIARVDHCSADFALGLHQFGDTFELLAADDVAVGGKVGHVLQFKLTAQIFNQLVFSQAALRQKISEFLLVKTAVFILKAFVGHNDLFQLLQRNIDAHCARAFIEISAVGQHGQRVLIGLQALFTNGCLHILRADFFVAHFDDVVRTGRGDGRCAETDKSQCNQTQHNFGRAVVFLYG